MRQKSTSSLRQIVSLLGICAVWLSGITICISDEAMPPNTSKTSQDFPTFFKADQDLKAYFIESYPGADTEIIQGKLRTYCFALVYPYSGMDTTDLYCFVKVDTGWLLFLRATLWKTPPKSTHFRLDDDFVDVICKGNVVLKINPPR
jgi:hypothetical protein